MFETLKKHAVTIIVIVLVVVGFIIYGAFFVDDESDGITSEVVVADPNADLLGILSTLKSLSLDDGIFASPIFNNLIDFSKELSVEPVGRSNPFAPIGVSD